MASHSHNHSHNHNHNHNHSHNHKHAHTHTHHTSSLTVLVIAIVLLFSFAIVEAIAAWWTGSLALWSDAGHMTSDIVALMIAAFAAWIGTKARSEKHSYGFGRAEILAAWCSSLMLLGIAVVVIVEAIARIRTPSNHIDGMTVMIVAVLGIVINLIIAWILSRSEQNLNIRAAMLHVISDLAASFATLLAGAIIYFTHWILIDALLSIAIGIMIAVSSIRLLRESILILMEGVPRSIEYASVETAIRAIQGIRDIHDLHIWVLSSGRIALSAHIDIDDLTQWRSILPKLIDMLESSYGINHVTLQPEAEIFDCIPCK